MGTLTRFNEGDRPKDIQSDDFIKVPDGKYRVRVDTFDLRETSKGDPMLSLWFMVEVGEYTGSMIFKNSVIKTMTNRWYVEMDCEKFELFPNPFDKLEDPNFRALFLDHIVDITVKTKKHKIDGEYKEFQNVYINKIISKPTQAKVDIEESPRTKDGMDAVKKQGEALGIPMKKDENGDDDIDIDQLPF